MTDADRDFVAAVVSENKRGGEEIARLRAALADAIDEVVSWSSHASMYMRGKHKLPEVLARLRRHLGNEPVDPPAPADPYGRAGLMLIAAVRYCLGRSSYIVGDCADWMMAHWDSWPTNVRQVLQRDIEAEFERDDAARERGDEYMPLGMDMDREQWERVRRLWR